ncbi:uncharacterized protein LOC111685920 [Lucilia cuprina]|uniref:uncharacterized protein LOC111685920 n=1 Tax=Lucilia cuprina TaxID=7375 RepID=UPI001F058FFF|nr:uncharacterized protein LOC111685920 [Lucilia cuprina]
MQKNQNDASGYKKPKATINDKEPSTASSAAKQQQQQQQKMVVNNSKQTTTTGTSTNNNYLGHKNQTQPIETTSLNAASATLFASIWSKFSATCNEAKQQKILQKQQASKIPTAAAASTSPTTSNGNANGNNVTNRKKRKSKKNSNSTLNMTK